MYYIIPIAIAWFIIFAKTRHISIEVSVSIQATERSCICPRGIDYDVFRFSLWILLLFWWCGIVRISLFIYILISVAYIQWNSVGGVMGSVLPLEYGISLVRVPIWSNLDYEIVICCFSAKHVAIQRRSKD